MSGDYMDISSHIYLDQTNNDDSYQQVNDGTNDIANEEDDDEPDEMEGIENESG